jgi:hypothetical protein
MHGVCSSVLSSVFIIWGIIVNLQLHFILQVVHPVTFSVDLVNVLVCQVAAIDVWNVMMAVMKRAVVSIL